MKRIIFLLFILQAFNLMITAQEAPEGLFIASKAPDFKAKDQEGNDVRLKDLAKKGKVIIVFYRGQWCPYCNKFLSALQDSLQLIKDKGASLIAISPEKPESVSVTVEKTKAAYPVIHDEEMKIMKAYDVEYEVQENTLKRYKSAGIDVEENNGRNGKFLPITAVFIIGDEQTITYRFFEKDYKKRPAVSELLKQL